MSPRAVLIVVAALAAGAPGVLAWLLAAALVAWLAVDLAIAVLRSIWV
jgi:hypothetical protein